MTFVEFNEKFHQLESKEQKLALQRILEQNFYDFLQFILTPIEKEVWIRKRYQNNLKEIADDLKVDLSNIYEASRRVKQKEKNLYNFLVEKSREREY